MMRLESPEYLYLLLLLPVLLSLRFYTFYKRRKAIHLLGDKDLVYKMMPELSLRRENIKYAIVLFIFTLLVLLLARPQMGAKMTKEERNGIEVMIAMDISNSMMAEDVAPSRLDKTKLLIENLVDHFTKDRVGMVVFAGDAFVQLPITNDYVSAKMFMQSISPSLIPAQGTNIAEAIDLCMKSFTKQEKIGKAIILITDGEDHEGGAEEKAAEARKRGYNVFVLGVGTSRGAPVPDPNGGYLYDNDGQEVLSRLNEKMCQSIAEAGNGVYIHVENNNKAQEMLNSSLAQLQKGTLNSMVYSEYDEQFQALAIVILILILIELFVSENSNGFMTKLSRMANRQNSRFANKATTGKMKTIVLLFLLAFTAQDGFAQTDRTFIRNGNKFYRQQQFDKAEIEFRKALELNPNNGEAMFNMGNAKMMAGKMNEALDCFQNATHLLKDKGRLAQVYHNIGFLLQNKRDYAGAVNAYKQSLRNNPNMLETKYNLSLCQSLLKKEQKEKAKNQQDKKDKDDKKDKQKDKQKDKDKDKKKDKDKDKKKEKQEEQRKQILENQKKIDANQKQIVKQQKPEQQKDIINLQKEILKEQQKILDMQKQKEPSDTLQKSILNNQRQIMEKQQELLKQKQQNNQKKPNKQQSEQNQKQIGSNQQKINKNQAQIDENERRRQQAEQKQDAENKNSQNKDNNSDNEAESERIQMMHEQQKLDKENAEQLLNAAKTQEQATQEKVKKALLRRRSNTRIKNW